MHKRTHSQRRLASAARLLVSPKALGPLPQPAPTRGGRGGAASGGVHLTGAAYDADEPARCPPRYLERMTKMGMLLEMELGITGGEEDGVNNEDVAPEDLYTKPEEVYEVYKAFKKARPPPPTASPHERPT